ncbi:MAG: polymerase [Sporomusa sp.]|nr:polymerase [Sporomusa sp.]
MSEIEKLVLVDGHNLLFRMFYGVPARMRSRDGKLLNAVIGFMGAILKYIKVFESDYFLIIFDSEQPTRRNAEYEEYKKNRQSDFKNIEDDENPFIQLDIIKNLLDLLHIKYCEIDGYETDDVIASYVHKYPEIQSYIISADTDMLQLVNDNAALFIDRGKNSVLFDKTKVVEKYNVKPENIIDYKALVGDKSDNISGIFGIGHKTAAKLINNYGNIESIIDTLASINPDSLKKRIETNIEILKLNKSIIKLDNSVELSIELEKLKIDYKEYAGSKTIEILKENEYI